MNVIGLETATAVCSVAFLDDDRILSECVLEERNSHAEKVIPLVDRVLAQAQRSLGDADAIAISIGPGSFTGLRIGLSVAKGLSYSTGKPLIAVPTLLALAQRVVDSGSVQFPCYILPVLDARRDEVYCQCCAVSGGFVVPLWKERDVTVTDLLALIRDMDIVVTGDGREKLFGALESQGNEVRASIRFADDEIARCSAGSVARLGERMCADGKTADPVVLEPMYIKEFYFKTKGAVQQS